MAEIWAAAIGAAATVGATAYSMSGSGGSSGGGGGGTPNYWNSDKAYDQMYHGMRNFLGGGNNLIDFSNQYDQWGMPSRDVLNMRDNYVGSNKHNVDYNNYRNRVLGSFDAQSGAASQYLNNIAGPAITNSMTAAGMGRSGAIGESIGKAAGEMALPLAQMRSQWEADAPQQLQAFQGLNSGMMSMMDMERQAALSRTKNKQGLYQMGMGGLGMLPGGYQQQGGGSNGGWGDMMLPMMAMGMSGGKSSPFNQLGTGISNWWNKPPAPIQQTMGNSWWGQGAGSYT